MNIHKNARLTLIRRVEMVEDVLLNRIPSCQVAAHFGVSEATVRKWRGRFLAEGREGLADRSSRPARSPRALEAGKALTIVELRKKRMTQARIAQYLQVSKATVSRVLGRAGLSKLTDLDPVGTVQRYEHERPGDLIHIDTKSSAASKTPGIARPATGEIDPAVPGRRSCLSQLTTMPASRLRSSILMKPKKMPTGFAPILMPILARSGCELKRF